MGDARQGDFQSGCRDSFECVGKQPPVGFGIIRFPFAAQTTIRAENGFPKLLLPSLRLGQLFRCRVVRSRPVSQHRPARNRVFAKQQRQLTRKMKGPTLFFFLRRLALLNIRDRYAPFARAFPHGDSQALEQHQLKLLDIKDAEPRISLLQHSGEKSPEKRKIEICGDSDGLGDPMPDEVFDHAAGNHDGDAIQRAFALGCCNRVGQRRDQVLQPV